MAPGHRADGLLRGGVSIVFSRMAGTSEMLWVERRVAGRCAGLGLRGRCARCGLLRKLLAEALAIVLARRPYTALLSLITAHDAVRAWKVGDMEVKNDRAVRGQVVGREPEGLIVKLVATMFLNSPRVRALWHDEKAREVLCESSSLYC